MTRKFFTAEVVEFVRLAKYALGVLNRGVAVCGETILLVDGWCSYNDRKIGLRFLCYSM